MNRIFMFILQILLLTSHAFGEPVSPEDKQGLPACSEDRRTVLNIIWSCLVTIFACTWLSIHPNVPGRNITTKGAISWTVERARPMIVAILAPEIIVGWATLQFTVAWRVRHGEDISIASVKHAWREKTDELKPILAHGFFLSMGGFYYTDMQASVCKDLMKRTTDPDILRILDALFLFDRSWDPESIRGVLVDEHMLERDPRLAETMVAISAETIQDKSKGDALSKTISILQISWFIIQCIARAVQHLPITLLEMAALAFTSLTIITYCLWWHKPLNVKYHISLDSLNSSESMRTLAPKSRKESASQMTSMGSSWASYAFDVAVTFLFGSDKGRDNIEDGAMTFSAGNAKSMLMPTVIGVCVGSLFGAFHCMAWSFYFPSHTEMVLW